MATMAASLIGKQWMWGAVFPGQGAQYIGMARNLLAASAKARHCFEEVDEALGYNLTRLCQNGPDEELNLSANAQPAILATSVASFWHFTNTENQFDCEPSLLLGHSLGEISALCAAESINLSSAVQLVRLRGLEMQKASPPDPAMVVVNTSFAEVFKATDEAQVPHMRIFIEKSLIMQLPFFVYTA